MKTLTLNLALALIGLQPALAYEPAIECVRWEFSTDNMIVDEYTSQFEAGRILTNGADFGFVLESENQENHVHTYYIVYNRNEVSQDPELSAQFNAEMNVALWHINSLYGRSLSCAYSAPKPWPRISGSN